MRRRSSTRSVSLSSTWRFVCRRALARHALRVLPDGSRDGGQDVALVDPRVPGCEVAKLGVAADSIAIRGHGGLRLRPELSAGVDPEEAGGDDHARRQALDVPFPRTRDRLVEVVDVEYEIPFGWRTCRSC